MIRFIFDAAKEIAKVVLLMAAITLFCAYALGGGKELKAAPKKTTSSEKATYYIEKLEATEDIDEFHALYSAAGLDWIFGPIVVDDFEKIEAVYDERIDHVQAVSDIRKGEAVLSGEAAK